MLNLESSKIVLDKFKEKILKSTDITQDFVKSMFKEIQIKGKNFYMPVRLTLTGSEHGLEMFNIISILGKDEVLNRLNNK